MGLRVGIFNGCILLIDDDSWAEGSISSMLTPELRKVRREWLRAHNERHRDYEQMHGDGLGGWQDDIAGPSNRQSIIKLFASTLD